MAPCMRHACFSVKPSHAPPGALWCMSLTARASRVVLRGLKCVLETRRLATLLRPRGAQGTTARCGRTPQGSSQTPVTCTTPTLHQTLGAHKGRARWRRMGASRGLKHLRPRRVKRKASHPPSTINLKSSKSTR